ncbi:UbiA prenyltransferase [Mesorhizobium prunaredense]|uniref:UbiA prenyltransferase n=2 Tax=Mesorhizobium TaxID=68287 RepID=A0A1R3V780_9HYPH|nr:UbiA family prenyltransferase [Mesorhizobium prunaredense]SIT55754.1 UbiA prenyltransferase [Mesorhizobium prunaredense]
MVDLDGTLIQSDLLMESFLALFANKPFVALRTLAALREGKAAFKTRIVDELVVDVARLPYNACVLAYIEAERAKGRPIYLASASDIRLVRAVSGHLGLFDGVLGSGEEVNLAGKTKAEALCERFGERGFAYIGGDRVDLHVWSRCGEALVAGGTPRLLRQLRGTMPFAVSLDEGGSHWRDYVRALRPHQWLKNILVFAPAIAGHVIVPSALNCIIAFLSFSFCASAVYIVNDLLDLPSDREHPRKCRRPFASGAVPLIHGIAMVPALLLASLLLALTLTPTFLLVVGGYLALTTAYSLYLKRKIIADVMTLAILYALRLVGGGVAAGVAISHWLEALSMFLFLSLALVKRCTELVERVKSGQGDPAGRGYQLGDLPSLEAMATASGYLTALVMALYLNSEAVTSLYRHPERLWLICIAILFWISRIIIKTRRGEMNDDPVVFAVRDRVSLVTGLLCAFIVMASM